MAIRLYHWTDSSDSLPPDARVQVWLASPGTAKWQGPIEFLIDTGADTSVVPADVLQKLGLVDLPDLGIDESTVADGTTVQFQQTAVDLAVICMPHVDSPGFLHVPISVFPAGTQPLLGMDVLRAFNLNVNGGEFLGLEPNSAVLFKKKRIK